ncbi:MAG TPA: NAD(P)-dependent oxidoreductase [Candidatus Saccharimonadales bacterium]
MSSTILVTDTLFIFDEHIKQLEQAGFTVERLAKPDATEEELCLAIKGKVGYILGGLEKVTPAVIAAADELKAIAFTGSDWRSFVPAYAEATERDILITNAPGANAYAVAEYTITLMLMMLRRALELGSTGTSKFMTTHSIVNARVGIVGMGRIGEMVARMLVGLGVTDIVYWSRTAKPSLQDELGLKFMPLAELVATSDIITTHVPGSAGEVLTGDLLKTVKDGAVLINTGADESYNKDGLYDLLADQKARAAFDNPIDEHRFAKLTADVWFYSNACTAYNTHEAAQLASDMATQSLINLLTTGQDDYRVN